MYKRPVTTRKYLHAQSATEYISTYAWAIMIMAIIIAILYYFFSLPSQSIPSMCTFQSSLYCKSLTVLVNTTAHNATIIALITNQQQNPIESATLTVQINGVNTTTSACLPGAVIGGGLMVCIITYKTNITAGSLVTGTLYLDIQSCTAILTNCLQPINETYVANFADHADPFTASTSPTISFDFNATSYSPPANNSKDQLTANVRLSGVPLAGATVYFKQNNSVYGLSLGDTLTGTNGSAYSAIYGNVTGEVSLTASYAGLSNTIVINFVNPGSPPVTTATTTIQYYTFGVVCEGPVNTECGAMPAPGISYSEPVGSNVPLSTPQTTPSTPECPSGTATFVSWSNTFGGYAGTSLSASFPLDSNTEEIATYSC